MSTRHIHCNVHSCKSEQHSYRCVSNLYQQKLKILSVACSVIKLRKVDKYKENYLEALEGYAKAAALDPTWDDPKTKEQTTLQYLNNTEDLIKSKVIYHFQSCSRLRNRVVEDAGVVVFVVAKRVE